MKRIKSLVQYLFAAVAETLHHLLFGYVQRMGLLLSVVRTSVTGHTDTIYSISASLPATYDATGYGTTTGLAWTVIGKVESFTPYGSKRSINEFVPITGAVEFLKGAPRYGQGALACADIPGDAGQVILKAAEASANRYSMKITYPDGEIHYLDIINAGWEISGGKEGAPLVRTATIAICRAPVVVVAV